MGHFQLCQKARWHPSSIKKSKQNVSTILTIWTKPVGNAHDSAETKNIIQQKKKKKDMHSALGYKIIFFP